MNMNMLRAAALGGALVAASLATPVVAAVTITGEVSDIDFGTSDPGLVITANPVAFPTFTLNNAGDFADFTVLTVGTNENTVNFPDDFVPMPISVAFQFSNPAGAAGAPVSGNTVGFYTLSLFGSCGGLAGGCGSVTFNAPSVFNFSQGGQFSVALSNATFTTPGSANVTGRFTLISAPVPEPSTWAMLVLGFGAIGGAMRSRRSSRSVRVTYA